VNAKLATVSLLLLLPLGCSRPSPPPVEAPSDLDEPIPRPDLTNLPENVRLELEAERAAADKLLASEGSDRAKLAESLGRLGRLYHAYQLTAAAPCYRYAARWAPGEFRWHYLGAVLAQARGEVVAAAAGFEHALEIRPDDPSALVRLAEVRLGQARTEEAAELFGRVVGDPDVAAAAHHGLGRLAAAAGESQQAIDHFERVLELQPRAQSVHYLLAAAYRRLANREAAERHLERGGSLHVTFPDPLVREVEDLASGLGPLLQDAMLAMQEERFGEAEEAYRAALEIEPTHPTALRSLALALRKRDDLPGAVRQLRRMLEVYPDHALAQHDLATMLLEQESFDEAVSAFARALELDPDFKEAHFNLGVALAGKNRLREAIESFSEVLRIDPRYPLARTYTAMALSQLGESSEAIAVLREEVEVNPGFILPRQRLGDLLARAGDRAGAREQHRAVLGLDAPMQEKALAHFQLGQLADKPEEAGDHYRQALRLFPELWQARFNLANILQRGGELDSALVEYGAIVAAQPDNALARAREAEALVLAGRSAEARRRLEEGLEVLPNNVDVAHAMARLLATAPDAEVRNGVLALRLAQQVMQAQPAIESAETVAMALAELERFDEAIQFQRQLLVAAEREGRQDALPRLRSNLARYERGERASG
jgi:tetratricopeptide (TPR) repeat protein